MKKKLIGIIPLAEILDVAESWIYSRTRTNEIPHYKIGKYCKFDESEVFEWLKLQSDRAKKA